MPCLDSFVQAATRDSGSGARHRSARRGRGLLRSHAVTLVIPLSASAAASTRVGRIIAGKLTAALGQQVIVENRPGAGSVIGTRAAVQGAGRTATRS